MRRRNPVPRQWLMTDERMGDALWRALRRLPPGSGVVFRHYATPPAERRTLGLAIRRIAHARGLVLVSAGAMPGIDGRHGGRRPNASALLTRAVHDRREAQAAAIAKADAVFVSPVYPTRSHPGAAAIGPAKARRIGRTAGAPIIALGGVTPTRWRKLRLIGFYGWAAIDGWR